MTAAPLPAAPNPASSSPRSSRAAFLRVVLYAILGTVVFVLFLLYNRPTPRLGGANPGQQLPKLEAIGWLNGDPPRAEELRGRVVVIDAWATWCLPCRERAADLVYLHDKYAPKGVTFIGLTAEPEDQRDKIETFLRRYQITWLNGYGAESTLTELGAEAIPMVWVVDRYGNIVWNENSSLSLDQGIEAALAIP